ncbi:MAG: general stress protein [Anaerolineae bacterium]
MRTIVGLFRNAHDADMAVNALRNAGFTNTDLSVMARDEVMSDYDMDAYRSGEDVDAAEGAGVGAVGGAAVGGITGLLMGLGALAIPGIGPVIAAGTLATALGSAAAGTAVGAVAGAITGGVVAALVDMGIPQEDANFYAEGVKRGGVLVTVQTDESRAATAEDILDRFNAVEVEHERATWRSGGWNRFDDSDYPSTTYPRF